MRRYPGTTPFKPEDAPVYKGRKLESQETTNLILTQKTLILFAKSGMGKTSLLNAGVVPLLKTYGLFPIFIRFNELSTGTTDNPTTRFLTQYRHTYESFIASRARANPYSPQPALWETMCQNQFATRREVLVPTLIFDQFEEFFRTYPQRDQRIAFLKQLAELLSDAIPHQQPLPGQLATTGGEIKPLNLRVVFSIRSDMLHLMQEVSDYLPFVMRTRYELLPMSRPQATEAIREPGLLTDKGYPTGLITFPDDPENSVVENILTGLQDAYSGEIESFQLQLVCSYLEDKYVREGEGKAASRDYTVAQSDYGGIPGIQNINEAYFTDSINAITDQPRPAVMNELITLLNENGNRILKEDSQLALLASVKDLLVDRRILRRDKIQANTYFEISHDKIALALQKEKKRIEDEQRQEIERLAEEKRLAEERARRRKYATWFGLIGLFAAVMAYFALTISQTNKKLATANSTADSLVTSLTQTGIILQNKQDNLLIVVALLTDAKAKLKRDSATLENTNRKLVASINSLNQAKLKKAWSDYENGKQLMGGKLFKEALQTFPSTAVAANARYSPMPQRLWADYRKIARLVAAARRICQDMEDVKQKVSDAECLELDLRIACAHQLYEEAKAQQQRYIARYGNYCYPPERLEAKIKATNDTIAKGIQLGLVRAGLSVDEVAKKGVDNADKCLCTNQIQLRQ